MTLTTKTLFALTALALTVTLGACNTMAGLGEDVQGGGQNLEEAARDAKN